MAKMTTITFATAAAHACYHSMAEGMWEVRRDDGDDARAAAFTRLIEATPDSEGLAYPATFDLPANLREVAGDVLANCLDNNDGMDPQDPEAADYCLFDGDVTING